MTGAEAEGVLHAGTRRRDDGAVVSTGGRVLSVVGTGAGPGRGPRRRVPAVGEESGSSGSHHRTDIALRAVQGEVAAPTPA